MPSTPIILGTYEPYSVGERRRVPFTLDPAQHTYVIGASGSGKTHLLRNILIQMIARGDGVGFLDPHGDTAEELLQHIPPERIRDVCYFKPADLRHPIAWNPLAREMHSYVHITGHCSSLQLVIRYGRTRKAHIYAMVSVGGGGKANHCTVCILPPAQRFVSRVA